MKWFSLLQIPENNLSIFQQNFLSSSVDYQRFSFSHLREFEDLLWNYFPWYDLVDTNNSNSIFFTSAVLSRVPSPRGRAFQYIITIEWIWPVPLLFIEMYSNWLKNSYGRIDFYGSFFHFFRFLPDRIQFLYNRLNDSYIDPSSSISCTRVDIALDFSCSFPKDVQKWIKPSKNSLRTAKCYNWIDDKFNSISYLTKKNSGYGVRMYNKTIDIQQKWKSLWYGSALPPDLTRLEFEFYPPYSSHTTEHLINLCSSRVFGSVVTPIWFPYYPDLWFNVENAYTYFIRYAKSKWLSISTLLEEINNFHLTQTGESLS